MGEDGSIKRLATTERKRMLQTIREIGIFMIVAQAIVHFAPENSMKSM